MQTYGVDKATLDRHTQPMARPDIKARVASRPLVFGGSVTLSPEVQRAIAAHDASLPSTSGTSGAQASLEPSVDRAASGSASTDVQLAARGEPRTAGSAFAAGTEPQSAEGQAGHVGADDAQAASAAAGARASHGVVELYLSGCGVSDRGLMALLHRRAPSLASLTHLDVSACPGITARSLQFVRASPVLRSLRCDRCKGLTVLELALPAHHPLQAFSACACPQLSRVSLAAPHLQTLALTASRGLVIVSLAAPDLRSLLANQCASLRTLELRDASPLLGSANFMGCRNLATAALTSLFAGVRNLRTLNVGACHELTMINVPGALLSLCALVIPHWRAACLGRARRNLCHHLGVQ